MAKNQVMGKEKKEDQNVFAKGGTTKMFGLQDASPALPGTTSPNNGNQKADTTFKVSGGSKNHMAGPQDASPAPAGSSSPSNGPYKVDNSWGVSGGKGKMFGHQSANTATPGISGPTAG